MKNEEKEVLISLLKSIKDSNNAGTVPSLIAESLVEVFSAEESKNLAHWTKYHTDRLADISSK